MPDATEITSQKRQQRQLMLVGGIVAAVPFACQLLMLIASASAPDGTFPAVDRSFSDPRFWAVQVVLLCVAVSGNAIVDCVRIFWTTGRVDTAALTFLLWLVFLFFIESMMFSVTLLASRIGWPWLGQMIAVGFANLFLAYGLQMELAEKA
jgi:hypothetical protein